MPFTVPTLAQVRATNRDYINSKLLKPLVPNSVTRIVADANGAAAHGVYQYINWLSLQLLPDTAETEFLDRWANLFLFNADGSIGRKQPTQASGLATLPGLADTFIPLGTVFTVPQPGAQLPIPYQSTQEVTIGVSQVATVPLTSVNGGANTNLTQGDPIQLQTSVSGVFGNGTIVSMSGGSDEETDDELRARVLQRLQKPPMGGDADDWVKWSLEFPGVTRAWTSPLEMGIGTVTVRFMMDDLRSTNHGFPNAQDVENLQTFLDTLRPVTALDLFVVAPVPFPISFTLNNLINADPGTLQNIQNSVQAMLLARAAPAQAINGLSVGAQEIFASWISFSVSSAVGVVSFDLVMNDQPMPNPSSIAVLGNIIVG